MSWFGVFWRKTNTKNHEAYNYPLAVICIHLPSSEIDSGSDEASYPVIVSVKRVERTVKEGSYAVVTSKTFSSSIKPKVAIFDGDNLSSTQDAFVEITLFECLQFVDSSASPSADHLQFDKISTSFDNSTKP